jgi:hypothetical protein
MVVRLEDLNKAQSFCAIEKIHFSTKVNSDLLMPELCFFSHVHFFTLNSVI